MGQPDFRLQICSLSIRHSLDKNPLDRARAAYIATLYDPVFSAWFGYAKSSGGKDVKEFDALLSALRTFAKNLPEEYASREDYNTADILLGPMIVSWNCNSAINGLFILIIAATSNAEPTDLLAEA
jgi:hypothetical protein